MGSMRQLPGVPDDTAVPLPQLTALPSSAGPICVSSARTLGRSPLCLERTRHSTWLGWKRRSGGKPDPAARGHMEPLAATCRSLQPPPGAHWPGTEPCSSQWALLPIWCTKTWAPTPATCPASLAGHFPFYSATSPATASRFGTVTELVTKCTRGCNIKVRLFTLRSNSKVSTTCPPHAAWHDSRACAHPRGYPVCCQGVARCLAH